LKKKSFIPVAENSGIPAREKGFSDQIIDSSRSMISIINREYAYEKVNSTFCAVHKILPESAIGRKLEDFWGKEIFGNILKNNIDQCFTGKTIKYEACFTTPLLGTRYFEVIFRPLIADSGKVTHVHAETFDINDLKKSRQELFKKDAELRNMEKCLPVGFIRCDAEGRITHLNRAFLKIIDQLDEAMVINTGLQSYYPEGMLKLHIHQLSECKTKSFGIVSIINSKGKEIPCRVSAYLSIDNGSSMDFAFEDCSRELMLEKRLMQAQKLETIGALAGGIAHDFNNILATISGYSEMLQEDLSGEREACDKITRIQSALTKAKSLIDQILTFSRQVEQEKIPVCIDEVLRETIGFVNSSIPANILLKSTFSARKVLVLADPTQLFRVFLNLMTNAIQAMESGGTLTIKMKIIEGNFLKHELNKDIVADEYVLVTVRDTGIGMDPSLVERIFEPFFTTRETGKGTGLGLSVTHGIITEMEGEILVSSSKEKGSVFYVYLPVSKIFPETFPGKKKKILFITGNKYESRILSLALRNKGFDLIYISDRPRLNKVLADKSQHPDLIIYMSDSRRIRQEDLLDLFNYHKINLPCILITDPDQELSEEKLLNSGIIKQILSKPVSLREITNAIQVPLRPVN
jgi:signal transduction histidine kinase/PAS domain-containing protein